MFKWIKELLKLPEVAEKMTIENLEKRMDFLEGYSTAVENIDRRMSVLENSHASLEKSICVKMSHNVSHIQGLESDLKKYAEKLDSLKEVVNVLIMERAKNIIASNKNDKPKRKPGRPRKVKDDKKDN